MTTLSVPLTPELEEFIKRQVKSGRSPNKAAVVRSALRLMSEEEAVQAVLESERDVVEGRILRGDLRKIVARFK